LAYSPAVRLSVSTQRARFKRSSYFLCVTIYIFHTNTCIYCFLYDIFECVQEVAVKNMLQG
jgi:hypothetical protein